MNPVFQIKTDQRLEGASAPSWGRLGLDKNPFPESGVLGSTLYTGHIPSVVNKIQVWLNDIAAKRLGEARGPFAIEGTIGAGKTHLLAQMEMALGSTPGITAIRENLVNAGGGRLLLSSLFGANLRLGEIATSILANPDLEKAIEILPSASPLRPVLSNNAAKVSAPTLALWLRGSPLTKSQLQAMGGRSLDGEGERLRAVIHLLRISAALDLDRLVVLLLDQLEDLERRSEITPLRRARFLTDLRIFIDEGLEGAPIALCTAWNTQGTAFMNSLQSQYPALASRLDNRAMVPGLPQAHLLPFAQTYLDDAYGSEPNRRLTIDARITAELAGYLKPLPGGDIAPREWLDQLRQWAEREVAKVHH